jgi:hypothetical protein
MAAQSLAVPIRRWPISGSSSAVSVAPALIRAIRLKVAFGQDAHPAREQFEMTARDRHRSVLADFEADHGKMRGGITVAGEQRDQIELLDREQVVERHDAVVTIFAEAAHIADWQHVCRNTGGETAMFEIADPPAGDQRLGAYPRHRRDRDGASPQ